MINQSIAMDEKKTRHLGKLFNTIDFEFIDTNLQMIEKFQGDTPIGNFLIGGKEFQITLNEVEQIENTMKMAKTIFAQKYRLGHYGH